MVIAQLVQSDMLNALMDLCLIQMELALTALLEKLAFKESKLIA